MMERRDYKWRKIESSMRAPLLSGGQGKGEQEGRRASKQVMRVDDKGETTRGL
jgi:hypothetical protein